MSTFIFNNECTWGDCIYTGNKSNWLETLVNCITSGSPLANQNQGTEKVPTFETESQEATIFKELQHKKVFIDAAREDKALLSQFERKLDSKSIKPIILIPQDNNPTEMFNQLEHALDDCDEIIAFYKEAPLGWLTQRLRLYRKAQARRKGDKLTICIHSPNTQPQGIKLPPNARWETT